MRARSFLLFPICLASPWAGAVCVHDVAGFQQALDNALGSTTQTNINLVRGTYDLTGTELQFLSTSDTQGRIDVTGGYNTDCTTHINNPALTVIDGHGASSVLSLVSNGGLSVRHLTIQNGAPAGVVVAGAGVIFDYNIVRGNQGGAYTTGTGLYILINVTTAAYDVQMYGNLVVGNSAGAPQPEYAAGSVTNVSGGNIYFNNNTVADNTGTAASGCEGLATYASPGKTYVSNSIFWHNTNCGLDTGNGAILVNNDYGELAGPVNAGSGDNLGIAPQFNGSGSYSLQGDSPLLGQGTLTPTGGLPTIDIEGNPRSYKSLVDMGAYERGNLIFGDGFDN